MYKEFICLANSRKVSGRCIAGKELIAGAYGNWIRPISERRDHEISEIDRRYQDGSTAQVFDIVGVTFKSKSDHPAQIENYTINDGYYWSNRGKYAGSLDLLVDEPPSLWQTGHSSYNGTNDRVPTTAITAPGQSLYLIKPENLEIIVRVEGAEFGNGKKRVRASFLYRGTNYLFSVTDPEVERIYLARGEGRYIHTGQCYMTISLGEAWEGYYYKLAAGIFEVKQ